MFDPRDVSVLWFACGTAKNNISTEEFEEITAQHFLQSLRDRQVPMYKRGAEIRRIVEKMRNGDSSAQSLLLVEMKKSSQPLIQGVMEEVANKLGSDSRTQGFDVAKMNFRTKRIGSMLAQFPLAKLQDPWLLGCSPSPLAQELFLEHLRDGPRAAKEVIQRSDDITSLVQEHTSNPSENFDIQLYTEIQRLGEARAAAYEKELPFGLISVRTLGMPLFEEAAYQAIKKEADEEVKRLLDEIRK